MSMRGRGCLELRPSDDPFFQPVSQDIGRTAQRLPDGSVSPWSATRMRTDLDSPAASAYHNTNRATAGSTHWDEGTQEFGTSPRSTMNGSTRRPDLMPGPDGNFNFLYSRESDKIGGKVRKPDLPSAQPMTRAEFLRQRLEARQTVMAREGFVTIGPNGETIQAMEEIRRGPARVEPHSYLEAYKHAPKEENPLYLTTGNQYGIKPLTMATVVTERHNKQQTFSKSFGNVKPQNTSLNTSITRSNVHTSLDPQFA